MDTSVSPMVPGAKQLENHNKYEKNSYYSSCKIYLWEANNVSDSMFDGPNILR